MSDRLDRGDKNDAQMWAHLSRAMIAANSSNHVRN